MKTGVKKCFNDLHFSYLLTQSNLPFRAFAAYEEHVSSYAYEVIWDNLKFFIKNFNLKKHLRVRKQKKTAFLCTQKRLKRRK